jgi:hypothetical protein
LRGAQAGLSNALLGEREVCTPSQSTMRLQLLRPL